MHRTRCLQLPPTRYQHASSLNREAAASPDAAASTASTARVALTADAVTPEVPGPPEVFGPLSPPVHRPPRIAGTWNRDLNRCGEKPRTPETS
ncbi:hypothetical protein NDU88_001330 [Pleurodeles waltl]|uniref:Uncharacterized protein n=1 Tax=Pleurodeles waltl TaxID=8319 RepID=A0AAV7L955_PLEWA|nr:hypothetical protein NDU88_001330 [Pleurodeles waltl]